MRVLVADAHPLFRDALVRAIAGYRMIELAHATDELAGVREAVERHRPDVVVIDRELLAGDLVEPADDLAGGARLLLLAAEVTPDDVYRALEHGVAGYVSKDAHADAVGEAVLAVGRGETRLDATSQTLVAGEIRLRGRDERPQLSRREQQILELIADGQTAPQVAAMLHISTATVKTHLLHLYEKLGVAERAAAVAVGMRFGLLE
ncbi:response regulator transcription factor [Conexibacter stalactiti]|uniref:Response regulator transcription factor n=1 Tax=Conexibacter stalactiti TaxID=1940611 RepID=A0ABU4HJC4_9ACTN|nr:response regulator transcription factor [Conexibacter stalactiti]MDW5593367.1 response regulator transcription factor [Conexibacter stalactiti]MEC5034008.1 response regulator transcription factor [Conexibacter stalactiti]